MIHDRHDLEGVMVHLIRGVDTNSMLHPGDVTREILRRIEENAPDRIVEALVGTSPELRHLYHFDPVFHAALDVVAQIATAAVLGDHVTREEQERRSREVLKMVDGIRSTAPRLIGGR